MTKSKFQIKGLTLEKLREHNFEFLKESSKQKDLVGISFRHAFRVFDAKTMKMIAYSHDLGFNKAISTRNLN